MSNIGQVQGGSAAPSLETYSPSSGGLSAEERLLALIIYTRSVQMEGAETSVELNSEKLEQLRAEVKKALDEAKEAQKESGFFAKIADFLGGDVASIAMAIAAVAAVVASGGAAAAILGAVAAAASLAASHAKELGIPAEIAVGIAIVASIAGLCVGNAKGLLDIADKVRVVASKVETGAMIAHWSARGGGAVAGKVSSDYRHDADHLRADARQAQGNQELVSYDIDAALDRLASALDQQGSAAENVSSMMQRSAASSYSILDNMAGAA